MDCPICNRVCKTKEEEDMVLAFLEKATEVKVRIKDMEEAFGIGEREGVK